MPGWAVVAGDVAFGALYARRDCLADTKARESLSVYGSLNSYDGTDLWVETSVAFANLTMRDTFVAFRVQSWPNEAVVRSVHAGYTCETVTDGGVTRLFLREWANGTSVDLAKSVPFVYDVVGLFYGAL